jgi:hypothetical protein
MMELPDHELLNEYVRHHSESAFAELVRRHLPLVYSAAVRVTGDPESAEDIAQVVFLDLADKAGSLPTGVVLPGWLYRAATFAGSKRVRTFDFRETAPAADERANGKPSECTIWKPVGRIRPRDCSHCSMRRSNGWRNRTGMRWSSGF